MSFNTPSYINSATTFIQLTDVPNSYSGQGGKFVKVKPTEDGLEFVSAASGVTKLDTVSSIDDSNTSFVFAQEPAVVIINGAVYDKTGGMYTWSWNSGTSSVVLNQPVGTGGEIFALV